MKKFTMKFDYKLPFLLFAVLIAGVWNIGCKKSTDLSSTSAPSLSRVTTTIDRVSSIDSVSYAEWVVIHGSGLSSVTSVKFNSVAVNADSIYASDSTITVKVPSSSPDSISNKIYVTTKHGSASLSLVVEIPAPQITAVSPNIASVGDQVVISGTYLSALQSVYFGTVQASVVSSTDTTIKVKVPDGANGTFIKVTTGAGSCLSSNAFGAKSVIYDDALNTVWSLSGWGTTVTSVSSPILRGTNALKLDLTAWGAFAVSGNLSLSGYNYIKLSLYGSSAADGKTIRLELNGSGGVNLTVKAGQWVTYTVPLSSLGSPATLQQLWLQEYTGGAYTIYLDDMVLL